MSTLLPQMEEDRRIEILKKFPVLDTPPEQALDDLTHLAATICGTPIAFISLIDEQREWLKSKVGVDWKEIPRDRSFSALSLRGNEILTIPDAASDPRFVGHAHVIGEPNIRFYAGAPLVTAEEEVIGRLCVMDRVPRTLTAEQESALKIMARQVMTHFELLRRLHELKLSEERFQLLARTTNDAIWDWDMEASTVWWNEGLEGLFGFQREEVEPGIESWMTRIHPDDCERVRGGLRNSVNQGQESFSEEYRFQCKSGSYAYVLGRGQIIRNAKGRLIRMIGCMTDLSDRMQAEQQIAEQAALINQARDAILVRDLSGNIRFWNNGADRVYGWRTEEACGMQYYDLLKPDMDRAGAAEQELLEKGEWTGELEEVNRQGEKVLLDCRWTLVRDDMNRPKSFLHINTDVTDRRKVEQHLLRAQRMEGIGTLAGGIAHDLNNALGPVIMSLNLLKKKFPDPDSQSLIGIISTSAHRGADMVKQVLSFARGVEGQRENLQVEEIVKDIEQISNDTFLKNVTVRTRIAKDLWTVQGDRTQLHQVLLNLCVNARDAMPLGGTITISAENVLLDEHYTGPEIQTKSPYCVCLQVEDSGIGMKQETIRKIFDPFFTTKEVGKGTGLGLSTTMAIVRSHGGYIGVYSELGKGTNFKVYLPASAIPSAKAAKEIEIELPSGNGEWVLVVDDEGSVRQITQQTLEAYGYRVLVAQDGREAVSTYLHRWPEITAVLTDMMMPIMDGPAMIQVLRQINPKVSIIAASGLATDERISQATDLGVKHFIPKPYAAESLLKILAQIVLERRVTNLEPVEKLEQAGQAA